MAVNRKVAKQRPWRDVKEQMAAKRYLYLRQVNHENHTYRSDDEMRKEAAEYALESVRLASAGAIKDELEH